VIDPGALQMVLMVLTGWLDRRERQAVAYLIEENRLLRRQLGECRLGRLARPITGEQDLHRRWQSTSSTTSANGITRLGGLPNFSEGRGERRVGREMEHHALADFSQGRATDCNRVGVTVVL
jgi:hypothetical protein